MIPEPLSAIAIISLVLAGFCALLIVIDLIAGYKQRMWIMNIVWPITALYSGPLGLWAYYRIGRLIAMLAGFLTSYPVNWWLVRAGLKEKMKNALRCLCANVASGSRRLSLREQN